MPEAILFQCNARVSMISHSCIIKFQSIYNYLNTADKRAADFCLENPQAIAYGAINNVAEKAQCSPATFVRLAKRLGYSGYAELKSNILNRVADNTEIASIMNVTSEDTAATIAANVFDLCQIFLKDSLQAIEPASLDAAAKLMLQAKRFIFAAVGDAHFVAASAAQKFLRLGYSVCSSTDPDSQLLALSQMSESDALICISHSGRTASVCETAKIAQAAGVNVISITNFPYSPLAKLSDITLLTASFSYETMGEVIAKRIPALCVLDALYIFVRLQKELTQKKQLDHAELFLKKNKL
jgi:RpiR family carbohydrate utilization transcriptional regulator